MPTGPFAIPKIPQRSRVGFGALLVGYYMPEGEIRYAGKVGTGFNRELLIDF